ncbi:MAG: HAMP domain-containing histidine kinase [Lentisphaerae bacterium]|nr:HAMP domain-containing histidine kinase [Lentisphaerota bacterium]
MGGKHSILSLKIIAVLLVLATAALAGVSLWLLRRIQKQSAHIEAAESVIERGKNMISILASDPMVHSAMEQDHDWTRFSRQVNAIHAVENGLQYVSIVKNDVTVFHEQTGAADSSAGVDAQTALGLDSEIQISRKILGIGTNRVPVVVFVTQWYGDTGTTNRIELALKRETLEREEAGMVGAIGSMFKISLVTVIVSFVLCALLVFLIMLRETTREEQRRKQEHLAFAGVLANGIVHDFRNPMSALRLDVQMLRKEIEKEGTADLARMRNLADRSRETIDRMDRVFNEFLFMSKPASDEMSNLDICNSISGCLAALAPRLEQSHVTVNLQMPETPLIVCADEAAIRRAFMNVLTNAVQFSPPGQQISIHASVEHGKACVAVADMGPGVPESQMDRIFEMFVSMRKGGTGLGLFFAKASIERCGGAIDVANVPGAGARFTIRLPIVEQDEKA